MDVVSSAFARQIRQLRGERTLAEFAEFLGISSSALQRYETGERAPRPSFIERICAQCNVTFEWLALGDGARDHSASIALPLDELQLLAAYRQAAPTERAVFAALEQMVDARLQTRLMAKVLKGEALIKEAKAQAKTKATA